MNCSLISSVHYYSYIDDEVIFVAIHTHVAIHTLLILMFIIIVKKFIVYYLNIYIYVGCAYM